MTKNQGTQTSVLSNLQQTIDEQDAIFEERFGDKDLLNHDAMQVYLARRDQAIIEAVVELAEDMVPVINNKKHNNALLKLLNLNSKKG